MSKNSQLVLIKVDSSSVITLNIFEQFKGRKVNKSSFTDTTLKNELEDKREKDR